MFFQTIFKKKLDKYYGIVVAIHCMIFFLLLSLLLDQNTCNFYTHKHLIIGILKYTTLSCITIQNF